MGEQPGLSRRQMIKASAVAGAAAWTAPVIVGSVASPAAAGSGCGSGHGGFSYGMVIYKSGSTFYSLKYEGSNSCSGTNSTSGDISSCGVIATCNSGSCGSLTISIDSGTLKVNGVATTAGDCSKVTSHNNYGNFTANGVTIVFAFAHDGSLNNGCNHLGCQFCACGDCASLC